MASRGGNTGERCGGRTWVAAARAEKGALNRHERLALLIRELTRAVNNRVWGGYEIRIENGVIVHVARTESLGEFKRPAKLD